MSQLVENLCGRLAAKEPVAVWLVEIPNRSSVDGYRRTSFDAVYTGIVNYAPTELVLTAKSGTSVKDIELCLKDARQMLPLSLLGSAQKPQ